MIHENILIGGEESGGIGLKNYIPERDGIMLGFLLIEIVADYGKTLGELLDEMMDEVGWFCYGREDMHIAEEKKQRLMQVRIMRYIFLMQCLHSHTVNRV